MSVSMLDSQVVGVPDKATLSIQSGCVAQRPRRVLSARKRKLSDTSIETVSSSVYHIIYLNIGLGLPTRCEQTIICFKQLTFMNFILVRLTFNLILTDSFQRID